MAKKPRSLNKTETAAIITEASEMIQMMALDALGNEALADLIEAENVQMLTEAESDVIAQLDAIESSLESQTTELTIEEPTTEVPGVTSETPADAGAWDKAIAELSQDAIDLGVMSVAKAMDERSAFELDKNGDNANIQRTLKKARSQLATKRATAAMMVAGFDESQINRSKHQGARYNVYALGKLADVLYGVTEGGQINNAINNAIMRSLFKMRKSAIPFTMEIAKAAASDKIRVETAVRNLLVRHTVSASTAPTQASSTMQALTDLGVVSRTGSEKNPIFALTDAPIVAKLEAVLQAA